MTVELVLSAALCALCLGWIARNPARGLPWASAIVALCALMAVVWAGGQAWQPVVMEADVLTVRLKDASKPSQRILEENLGDLAKALEAVGMDLETEIPWVAERELAEAAIASANAQQSTPAWI